MSLDYGLKVIRTPLILDEFQVQNNLTLNFSYAFVQGAAVLQKAKKTSAKTPAK